jgi:hypothetical protein
LSAAGTERAFEQLRTRAARAGHTIHKRFEEGQEYYLATCWGQCRRFELLDQLQIFVELVTGEIDAKVRRADAR